MSAKLNAMCPINMTGYGTTSKNIMKSLSRQDVDISLFSIGPPYADNEEEKKEINKLLSRAHAYSPNSPVLKIWHQHDLAVRPGKGKYYAYPFFEIDKFKQYEMLELNSVDHLFTASEWGKQILIDNMITTPITVAPLGIDPKIFNENYIRKDQTIQFENDNYVFMHVGKWEFRKSQDFLIEAFNKAFTKDDNVELRLMPFNPFLQPEETDLWHKRVAESPLVDKIKILDRVPSQADVARIMQQADCGVFLSRAEGWNNEVPEMMALDKPIIVTNYSAHTEYCNAENSLLVEIDETETANDGKWFRGEGNWAKLGEKQMEQTVEYMRFVYNKEVKSNAAGLETAKKYTWDRTASIIRETIFN